ncbi:hypothetical protein DICA4_E10682 [Diutina catenulata]
MIDRLPVEVIEEIVGLIYEPPGQPDYTFRLCRLCDGWHDLLALASTCTYLRKALGTRVFAVVSLVRENQIDMVLRMPKSSEMHSDHLMLTRRYLVEVLERNFNECGYSDWARASFREYSEPRHPPPIHHGHRSRYRWFSSNCAVSQLECGLAVPLDLFPNLTSLKLLGRGEGSPVRLPNLVHLAANLSVAPLVDCPRLQRLDLLADFYDFAPCVLQNWRVPLHLGELNLFTDHSTVFRLRQVVEWLQKFTQLTSFSALISHRQRAHVPNRAEEWLPYDGAGNDLVEVIRHCESVTLDVDVILEWDTDRDIPCNATTLTLVQPFLTIGQLPDKVAGIVAQLSANARLLRFHFGEVIDNADIHALAAITNLFADLASREAAPRVRKLALEKCWSRSDDMITREYYAAKPSKVLDYATVWGRLPFNSPRYRKPDAFDIAYQSAGSTHDVSISPSEDTPSTSDFWSIETAKCDLEQYTLKPKPISKFIWG